LFIFTVAVEIWHAGQAFVGFVVTKIMKFFYKMRAAV